jgi:hypothetical protein
LVVKAFMTFDTFHIFLAFIFSSLYFVFESWPSI